MKDSNTSKKITNGLVKMHGGVLRCSCGREEPPKDEYFSIGWPKHCGYTMRWITARELKND